MKKLLILIASLVAIGFQSYATTYTKTTANDSHFNGTAFSNATVVGGDTILYAVGTHDGNQYFSGYVGVSEANPIVIDLNGQTIDGLGQTYTIRLVDCLHVQIINGTAHNASQCPIYTVESKGIVVEWIVAYDAGDTGIRIGFQSKSTDPSTWRENTVDPYARVKNCTVYDAVNEGIYISASNTHNIYFDANGDPYALAFTEYGEVSNNLVYNTGLDGIQMGAISIWGEIKYNYVHDYALSATVTHDNGIQMGTGSHGAVFGNIVEDSGAATGSMYQIQGDGVLMYNNVGYNGASGVNILSSYTSPNRYTWIFNNTFINVGLNGAYINSTHLRNITLANNIFHLVDEPSAPTDYYFRVIGSPDYSESNNLTVFGAGALTALNFTNIGAQDYSLGVGSTALTGGSGKYRFYIPGLKNNLAGNRRNFNHLGAY
jgi:hypothetical protein